MNGDANRTNEYMDEFHGPMKLLVHLYVGDRLSDVKSAYFDHSGDDRGAASFVGHMKLLRSNGYVQGSGAGTDISKKGVDMAEMYIKVSANREKLKSGSLPYLQIMA